LGVIAAASLSPWIAPFVGQIERSMNPQSVLHFWFSELESKQHFAKDAALDARIAERFGATLDAAARCELHAWRDSAEGRLAEIIVLDQFSRNVFRAHLPNAARAFAQDPLALALAQELVANGGDMTLPVEQRKFAYMPYMHSESRVIHQEALRLFAQPGLEGNLDFERRHLAIIERFGRYPHRNAILGRESTAEELAFLREAGSGF
jgi:uncharacterized protein (DUF924 family)